MLTLLLTLSSVLLQLPAQTPELTAPEVYVSIRPSSMDSYQLLRRRTPETFSCRAEVTQSGSHSLFLSADLVLLAGETQHVTTKRLDYTLEFAVTMKDRRAETIVTVKRGETLLTRQRSTMILQTPEAIVPVR